MKTPRRGTSVGAGRRRRRVSRVAKASNMKGAVVRRTVALDTIDWAAAVRGMNREHLERLSEATILPEVVVWEFEQGKFRGVDGYHRWVVAKTRGDKTLKVVVRRYPQGPTGQKTFDLDCIRLNTAHGLPLTRQERDDAIRRLWHRWGRTTDSQSDPITLDELARAFNLTKPRIHQILRVRQPLKVDMTSSAPTSAVDLRGLTKSVRGFSPLGRFSAAAKRLSTVLGDTNLVTELLRAHRNEVVEVLERLRNQLGQTLGSLPTRERSSDVTSIIMACLAIFGRVAA